MELNFEKNESKETVFQKTEEYLGRLALDISSKDEKRPWGGFFVIDESSTEDFIDTYFPDMERSQIGKEDAKLSPKILLVEPGQKLSWQYHNRRAELWRVVSGPVGVVTSESNEEGTLQEVTSGEIVQFDTRVRHRLAGLNNWGVVAEIWQHTDPLNPSDESDIVRLDDAYGRASK